MLVSQMRIALSYGIQSNKIIRLENGMIAEFEGNELVNDPEKTEKIDTKEILFGNEIDSDINDFVAREREALTQEGFLVISGMINLKEREIYGDVEIATSGFLPEFGQEDEIESIKEEFRQIVNTHLKLKKVDYKDLRQELKNSLSKKILKETKKRPILIPIIIDISGSNQQIEND